MQYWNYTHTTIYMHMYIKKLLIGKKCTIWFLQFYEIWLFLCLILLVNYFLLSHLTPNRLSSYFSISPWPNCKFYLENSFFLLAFKILAPFKWWWTIALGLHNYECNKREGENDDHWVLWWWGKLYRVSSMDEMRYYIHKTIIASLL